MKKVSGMLLIAALAGSAAGAQAQSEPQARGARAMPSVAQALAHHDRLGLTAEQVAQLESIAQDARARNAPLMAQLESRRPEWRGDRNRTRARGGQMPEQRAEMRARMENLTPEQRAELRERGPRRALTAEQRAEMRARIESLTPEQRAELRDRGPRHALSDADREVMAQLRTNRQEAQRAAMEVLTEEQRAQLQELRAEGRRMMMMRRSPAERANPR